MYDDIVTKTYFPPGVDNKEILRYIGCVGADFALQAIIDKCLIETLPRLTYRVCYTMLPLTVKNCLCDFGAFSFSSSMLSSRLKGCDKAIVFCATLGVDIDRIITKYSNISQLKALVIQAIGTERIESLCDMFCLDISEEIFTTNRFSPGYADIPIEIQKNIFSVLNATKNLGVTLNDSLLISPSKTVTAFIGIPNKKQNNGEII